MGARKMLSIRSIPLRTVSGCALSAAGLLLAAGCATTETAGSGNAVNSSLEGLRPPDGAAGAAGTETTDDETVARMLDESERLYNDLWSMGGERSSVDDPEAATAAKPADEPEPEPVSLESLAGEAPEEPEIEPAEQPVDPETRVRTLVGELAAALRADPGADPYLLAVRLAGLTAAGLSPAEAEAVIEGLAVDERESARAVLDVLTTTGGDPAALADTIAERAERLSESRPIRVGHAALCSRVEGFGRYTELPSNSFVAGQPMRTVVYTEVEHFDHQPASAKQGSVDSSGGDWEIRLSQELLLYHAADGLLAWRQPEEVTIYRTKTRLRDFFVVNRVDLPRSLTVGSYRLKIVMRDLADRSVDERIIPISVVADPRLATGYGG